MRAGSLVVYIGGQTKNDVEKGLTLEKDKCYVVEKTGWGLFGTPKVRKRAVVLQEKPGQIHSMKLFKEVQAPIDLSFLFN